MTRTAADKSAGEDLKFSRMERLAFIEFNLMFKGEARRDVLTERFDIAPSVATKDFATYHDLAPGNIVYNRSHRIHLKGPDFKPYFSYDVTRTLSTLSEGFGDGFIGPISSTLSCEAPYHLREPDLMVVAALSEAIWREQAVEIDYLSSAHGKRSRQIIPHTLVDGGMHWFVRAFDRRSGEFRDFLLTRVLKVRPCSPQPDYSREIKDRDVWWNRRLFIDLIPHPSLKHPEAVEYEYGMHDGHLLLDLRASCVGYLLRLWQVDCTADYNAPGQHYLALKNRDALSYLGEYFSALLKEGL